MSCYLPPVLLGCLYLCAWPLAAQQRVVDAGTRLSIPFTTVVVTNASVGTVADEDGRYELTLPSGADSLRFSALGYVTKTVAVTNLPSDTVALVAAPYLLQTAQIDATRFTRDRRYGHLPTSQKIVVQFIGEGRGAQIGKLIRLRREAHLKTARLSVVENSYGTAKCRLRFYAVEGDSIAGDPLEGREFLHEITGTGIVDIPLAEAGLVYDGELLMVLELLEGGPGDGHIYLGGALFKANGYARRHAGEAWRKFTSTPSVGAGFALVVRE